MTKPLPLPLPQSPLPSLALQEEIRTNKNCSDCQNSSLIDLPTHNTFEMLHDECENNKTEAEERIEENRKTEFQQRNTTDIQREAPNIPHIGNGSRPLTAAFDLQFQETAQIYIGGVSNHTTPQIVM